MGIGRRSASWVFVLSLIDAVGVWNRKLQHWTWGKHWGKHFASYSLFLKKKFKWNIFLCTKETLFRTLLGCKVVCWLTSYWMLWLKVAGTVVHGNYVLPSCFVNIRKFKCRKTYTWMFQASLVLIYMYLCERMISWLLQGGTPLLMCVEWPFN